MSLPTRRKGAGRDDQVNRARRQIRPFAEFLTTTSGVYEIYRYDVLATPHESESLPLPPQTPPAILTHSTDRLRGTPSSPPPP